MKLLRRLWVRIGALLGVDACENEMLMGAPVAFITLAAAVGDANVALFIQKLDGWLKSNKGKSKLSHYVERDGKKVWCAWGSHQYWADQVGIGLSKDQMRTIIGKAEASGVVIGWQAIKGKPKRYSIDYDVLETLLEAVAPENVVRMTDIERGKNPTQSGENPTQSGNSDDVRGENATRFNRFNNRFSQTFNKRFSQSNAGAGESAGLGESGLLNGDVDKKSFEGGDDFEMSSTLLDDYERVDVIEAYRRTFERNKIKPVKDVHAYACTILKSEFKKLSENPFMNMRMPDVTPPPSPLPVDGEGESKTVRPRPVVLDKPALTRKETTQEEGYWNAAYSQLQLQLDKASFETWLSGAAFQKLDNGVYVVGVRNSYARDMLKHRLYRNVRRVLSDIVGADCELRFEVMEKRASA